MRSRLRKLSTLLALLLVARAAIPLGYMLEADSAAGPASLSLVFCPLQNPDLDLSVFHALDDAGPHAHDHHHGAAETGVPSTGSLAALGDCGQWLGSQFVGQVPDHHVNLDDSLLEFELERIPASIYLRLHIPGVRHSRAPPFFS